jgi:hypothetical protein
MATEKNILQVLDALTAMPDASVEALMPGSARHIGNIKTIIDSKNILAVGISEKIADDKKTGKLALTFYVEKKLPLNKLKGNHTIPPTMPESMSGGKAIPTDVVEIGKLRPEANFTRNPFQPGNSIGHFKVGAGTFGAVVKDKDNQLYILSNCHVLANSGKCKIGDRILYPGSVDTGISPGDVKAKLHKFIPLDTSGNFINIVDCAIAKPTDEHLPNLMSEIKGLGLPKGVIKAKRGMKVTKVGRTTGKTAGEVKDVNFRHLLNYPHPGMSKVGFTDQVFCTRYTDQGDSGSLVIDKASGKAVGLHFAGAEGGSLFNPINQVLSALEVTLVIKSLAKKMAKKATKNKPSK